MSLEYENEELVLTREEQEMEMDAALDIEYHAHLKGISTQEYMELMTMSVNERTQFMGDDYEIGDEYDWDRSDKSQYCKHGKFIGSWWGPDILCGYCEAGE
jgi:FAD synthase